VRVIAAAAAKQQDDQDDNQEGAHEASPLFRDRGGFAAGGVQPDASRRFYIFRVRGWIISTGED
jgi:hypothetical protein